MEEEIYYSLTFKGLLALALVESGLLSVEEAFGTDTSRLNAANDYLVSYFERNSSDIEKTIVFLDGDALTIQKVPAIVQNEN